VLIVAGVLIFSIDWTVRDLATFIGALFIFEGIAGALTTGLDKRVRRANVITGLLSVAAGVLIIVWPEPGIVAVAIILGPWRVRPASHPRRAGGPRGAAEPVASAHLGPPRDPARRPAPPRPGRVARRDRHRGRHLRRGGRRDAHRDRLRGQAPAELRRRDAVR